MDWFTTLFGGEEPRDPNAPAPGSVIGAAVGRGMRQPSFNPMVEGGPELAEEDFDQARAMADFQREAGADIARLGRRMQYRPQIPTMDGEETAPAFPFAIETPSAPPTQRAARAVGIPQRFLDALIVQESGGDPEAKAPTSSATGHGQFIDQTWFNMLAQHAGRYGHPEIAEAFERQPRGHYKLIRPELRDELLDLRTDPQWAAIMAAEYSLENALTLRAALGRDPREAEVYLGHFLGPEQAVRLIQAAERDRIREGGRPTVAGSVVEPGSVNANRNIFYSGNRARTAGEVVALQSRKFSERPFIIQERGFSLSD